MENATIIIPARGGSKRIPGKNKRVFNGHPIIQWPILAAQESKFVDRVVVSTDDDDIREISMSAGVDEVIARPADLASDTAGTAPVIRHAIDTLGLPNEAEVICLYATAALPTSILNRAIELGRESPERFVVSVGKHPSPLERALRMNPDSTMSAVDNGFLLSRTQDLPEGFYDAGKVYVASALLWESSETMLSSPFIPLVLPRWASIDIDYPEDWGVAEALHRTFALGELT